MKRTQKAIKLSLFGLACLTSLMGMSRIQADASQSAEAAHAAKSPEEQALEIIKPFFTDPNYEVNESFRMICCKVADLLRKSQDPILQELAKALTEVCKKSNAMAVGLALKKYEAAIKQFITDELLPGTVLLARLNKSLKI